MSGRGRIDPAEVPESAIARLRAAAALAKLPAEYRAIPAACVGDARRHCRRWSASGSKPLLARAQPRQVIITDIRGHWAQPWIAPVVRVGRDGYAGRTTSSSRGGRSGAASWRRRCRDC